MMKGSSRNGRWTAPLILAKAPLRTISVDAPTRFLLYVGGHSPAKKCVVMWKISTIFGVEFE
jgi:hypothetical protein